MRHREAVAAQRRALPPGPLVQDYTLLEGPGSLDDGDQPVREVRLSELFSAPERPLVIYQFMYGKQQTSPCPMCTLWIDGYNGVAHHLARNIDFAVLAAADPAQLRAHARRRGWNRLRLLSAGDSTIKYDLDSEDEQGAQISTVSVFTRDADGAIRHQYSAHPRMSDTIDQRGIDLLSPSGTCWTSPPGPRRLVPEPGLLTAPQARRRPCPFRRRGAGRLPTRARSRPLATARARSRTPGPWRSTSRCRDPATSSPPAASRR